jgi:hypothetical protein
MSTSELISIDGETFEIKEIKMVGRIVVINGDPRTVHFNVCLYSGETIKVERVFHCMSEIKKAFEAMCDAHSAIVQARWPGYNITKITTFPEES